MAYIHQKPGWPAFAWDGEALASPLAAVRHTQGRLLGQMEALGFDQRADASLAVLTSDVVKSSAIEGEKLNPDEVRSSIARRLGLEAAGLPRAGRAVEGVVEMMLDGTRNFDKPLTQQRLFDWHLSTRVVSCMASLPEASSVGGAILRQNLDLVGNLDRVRQLENDCTTSHRLAAGIGSRCAAAISRNAGGLRPAIHQGASCDQGRHSKDHGRTSASQ